MIHLVFVHNPLFIYEMQFLLSKSVWSTSRCNWSASKFIMMMSYCQVHCNRYLLIICCGKINRAIKMHLFVSTGQYIWFCIQLNTFIHLHFNNLPVLLLYVMSQSTISDQIRPCSLITCLNCAAQYLKKNLKQSPKDFEIV